MMSNVTKALSGARVEAGMSMRALAKTLGVSVAFLSQIEAGRARFPFTRIADLPNGIRGPVIDAAQAELMEQADRLEQMR